MKRFSLISVLFAAALFACGPVTAASEPVYDMAAETPADIAAAIGIGFDAMAISIVALSIIALVGAPALLAGAVSAFRWGAGAASGLAGPGSGAVQPSNVYFLKEPRKPPA